MNFASILDIFQMGILVKLFVITAAIFYLVLATVIYRQVELLTQVLETKISPTVKMISLGQVVATVVLLFLAIILA